MSEIPFDNTYDILKHLPVKSLLRFRCLSKEYCSLIDSCDFINFHLSHSKITNSNRSLIIAKTRSHQCRLWKPQRENKKSHMVNLDCPDHQLVEFDHPLSVFSERDTRSYYDDHLRNPAIFGSCNGLIALYHPDEGVLLWNPSTKKQHKLPVSWGPTHKTSTSDFCYGFGYDPVHDDYKLIRIQIINEEREKGSRVMVYSVKHNCSRRIQDFPYNFSYNFHYGRNWGILVGSCLYWIVFKKQADQLIFSFSLEDERFREVPIPDVLKHKRYRLIELGEVGGCLSMCTDDKYDSLVEIWVMKEYGINESWIRIFSIFKPNLGLQDYLVAHNVKPIGYSKTGDKLFMDVHCDRLLECDLQQEEEEDQTSQQNHIPKHRKPSYMSDKRVWKIEILGGDIIMWDYSFICLRSLVSINI